jgi:signal transduction histidine kinase
MTNFAADDDPLILAGRVVDAYRTTHHLAYAVLDTDLRIIHTSGNFARLAQQTEGAVVGEPVSAVLWEFVGLEDMLLDVVHGQAPLYRLEHVNRERSHGSVGYLTFQVTPLTSDGRSANELLLLVEDTTNFGQLHYELVQDRNELRLLQYQMSLANKELQRLNRMKSIFLSMAAHDLRTPLSAIYGYVDLLLEHADSLPASRQNDFLEIIRFQSSRLSQLIGNVLDLGLLEEGHLVVRPTACDVNEVIAEVVTTLRVNMNARQVTVSVDTPAEPLLAWVEPERLLQILYNVVGNAVKYTHSGGGVRILAAADGDDVRLRIADDGPGMTEAELAHLFSLFYRTEDALESEVQGTGLGLYIVKTLVDAHNGRVEVTSSVAAGTTFTITLPKAVGQAA